MNEHLSDAQIERYVSRRAQVDELLESAQHLDACDDCRDRAAVLVDSGADDLGHVRKRRISGPKLPVVMPADRGARLVMFAVAIAVVVTALIVWWLLSA